MVVVVLVVVLDLFYGRRRVRRYMQKPRQAVFYCFRDFLVALREGERRRERYFFFVIGIIIVVIIIIMFLTLFELVILIGGSKKVFFKERDIRHFIDIKEN